jgi:hypothetical protein
MLSGTRTVKLLRLLSLFCLMAGADFAATSSGKLVDAKCYDSAKNNRNAYDSTAVSELRLGIEQCALKAKTRSFAIVDLDEEDLVLDLTGNAQAAQLIRLPKLQFS